MEEVVCGKPVSVNVGFESDGLTSGFYCKVSVMFDGLKVAKPFRFSGNSLRMELGMPRHLCHID